MRKWLPAGVAGAQRSAADQSLQSIRSGLNYQFGDVASNGGTDPFAGPTAAKSGRAPNSG
jgi:hypothetical protein